MQTRENKRRNGLLWINDIPYVNKKYTFTSLNCQSLISILTNFFASIFKDEEGLLFSQQTTHLHIYVTRHFLTRATKHWVSKKGTRIRGAARGVRRKSACLQEIELSKARQWLARSDSWRGPRMRDLITDRREESSPPWHFAAIVALNARYTIVTHPGGIVSEWWNGSLRRKKWDEVLIECIMCIANLILSWLFWLSYLRSTYVMRSNPAKRVKNIRWSQL